MVRYRRNFVPGGTFFFTVALADRRSSALVDGLAGLRSAFRAVKCERPFTIDAIVVLPEHLHAIFTLPDGDADFSARWRRIKGLFTRHVAQADIPVGRDDRGEYHVWQRRFWEHTIRNDHDLATHIDYIHFNPVKHGLVRSVRDWRYSSFHAYVRRQWLAEDWAGTGDADPAGFGEPRQ